MGLTPIGWGLPRAVLSARQLFLRGAVALVCVAGGTACAGEEQPGLTEELSIHVRQLTTCTSIGDPSTCEVDLQALAALGQNGLRICHSEPSVEQIHVTVDSVPPQDSTPHEYLWTCDLLDKD